MSATAFIEFQRAVPIAKWDVFCTERGLFYSPRTIGWNVYYSHDHAAEISLNNEGSPPALLAQTDRLDFDTSRPPSMFSQVSVSTTRTEKRESMALVAEIAREVVAAFRDEYSARVAEYDERLEPWLGAIEV